jgi:hypothetical protein
MKTFRRLYGDSPWQLVVLLASFVVSGYAASRVVGTPDAVRIAVWFLGAAIVFDLVLSPLLALADRGLTALHGRRRPGDRRVSPVNYVRVPVLYSGLLLLIFTPVIFQRSEPPYFDASGLTQNPYLDRWLAITAVLFGVALLTYAVAVLRAGRRAG